MLQRGPKAQLSRWLLSHAAARRSVRAIRLPQALQCQFATVRRADSAFLSCCNRPREFRTLSSTSEASMNTEKKPKAEEESQGGGAVADAGTEEMELPERYFHPDDCPDWQNPLHHNNPAKQKIFFDEFEEGEKIEMAELPPFGDGSGKVLASPHLHEIADAILNMSMLEVNELTKRMSQYYGFSDDDDGFSFGRSGGDAAGSAASEGDAEPAAEKTQFDLKLAAFDAKSKIKVIKEVRAITGIGLKEAKEMVEGAPKVLKKDLKKEDAEQLKAKLEEVGATVEII